MAWHLHIYGWHNRTSHTSSGAISHNTSSLKGLMLWDRRDYWLTWRSWPWRSHPMLYGCGCGVAGKSNCLTTSIEMIFFWLPLSTIKWSGVPLTHICEWKSCSPSSRSSSSWIVAVAIVEMGSTSIIYLLLLFSKSGSKSRFISLSFSSATNDCIERHSSVLCQGFLCNSHEFSMSFLYFLLPLFSYIWDWLSWGCPSLLCPCFSHLLCFLNFCSILTAYQ